MAPSFPDLARPALVARLEAAGPRLRLIEAPAGAGKSRLLATLAARAGGRVVPSPAGAGEGALFWDVPPGCGTARIAPDVADRAARLVIASRPGQRIEGLARLRLYEGAMAFDGAALAFTEAELGPLPAPAAARLRDELASWPAFLPCALGEVGDAALAAFLREALLTPLPARDVAALSVWCDTPARQNAHAAALLPPAFAAAPHRFARLSAALRRALVAELATRHQDEQIIDIAATLADGGQALRAMELLLDHGHPEHAARILERAQGRDLLYQTGARAFQRIVMRFPPEVVAHNETVLICVGKVLLKQGEMNRTRALMAHHLGSDFLDPWRALARGSRYSFEARTFRLNMMIHEDLTPSDTMLARLDEFMSDYPAGDHAKWAAYCNALLEFHIRRRNFRAAEGAAARALIYLDRAGRRPMLEFFIHLHRMVLRLSAGDAHAARRALEPARAALARLSHDAPSEHRMLRLAEACLAYEAGDMRPFAAFLDHEFDSFAAGELWPSLIDCALHYATGTFGARHPARIRPGALDRFWIHLADTLHFRPTMEIRMARLLQNADRWNDAADILQTLRLTIGRHWVEAAGEGLARLDGRNEVGFAMTWLRHAAHAASLRPYLDRQITAMMACPLVTRREEAALQLWLAHVHRRRRDSLRARHHLRAALMSIDRLGCYGVLSEEKPFAGALLADARLCAPLDEAPEVRACRAAFGAVAETPAARAARAGLSPREIQLLGLIAEELANKHIAHSLAISEVTVKFHLSNLYHKLGVHSRKEAVTAARALAWL